MPQMEVAVERTVSRPRAMTSSPPLGEVSVNESGRSPVVLARTSTLMGVVGWSIFTCLGRTVGELELGTRKGECRPERIVGRRDDGDRQRRRSGGERDGAREHADLTQLFAQATLEVRQSRLLSSCTQFARFRREEDVLELVHDRRIALVPRS